MLTSVCRCVCVCVCRIWVYVWVGWSGGIHLGMWGGEGVVGKRGLCECIYTLYILAQYSNVLGSEISYMRHATSHSNSSDDSSSDRPTSISLSWRRNGEMEIIIILFHWSYSVYSIVFLYQSLMHISDFTIVFYLYYISLSILI